MRSHSRCMSCLEQEVHARGEATFVSPAKHFQNKPVNYLKVIKSHSYARVVSVLINNMSTMRIFCLHTLKQTCEHSTNPCRQKLPGMHLRHILRQILHFLAAHGLSNMDNAGPASSPGQALCSSKKVHLPYRGFPVQGCQSACSQGITLMLLSGSAGNTCKPANA